MNAFKQTLWILVGLGMTLGINAKASYFCSADFNLPNYPNLSGHYGLTVYDGGQTATVLFNGVNYQLICKTVGPMGEKSCEENVHTGYNNATGTYDGAYSYSNSDTGQIYLGVSYGPGFYVQVGTFQSNQCQYLR